MAGGNSGGVESYLPIAAALAATIATDGAASPWLVEAMGATAAGALTSGAAAAAASGITAGALGQDAGKAALMGGVSGGIGGALGAYSAGTEGIVGAAGTEGVAGVGGAPITGANVAGTAAVPTGAEAASGIGGMTNAQIAAGVGNPATSGLPMTGAFTPAEIAAGQGTTTYGGLGVQGTTGANIPAGYTPGAESGGIGGWLANNKGIATLGGTAALGYLINQDNEKYGTPATETYDGPLSQFKYDPKKYTPLTTAQPAPAYQAKYPNYVKNPYNAYAAEGGKVVAMAGGGIAGASAGVMPAGGSVEEMSRMNAIGANQMFPQANISTNAFASPTNRPVSQNVVGSGGTSVDPYTGAERFAEGGATEEKQGIPLQAMPNMITQNAVANNNSLTQDLVSRMAARNAINPVPNQTPPVAPMQPAGIMAAQPYTPPTFTRPTNVAPIEFQNLDTIVGSKPYNERVAAEAEAQRQAEEAEGRWVPQFDTNPGGDAAGGLLRSYAAGGGIQSHLGGYAAGGNPRLLKGPGDGMSDNIPATIGNKQPARLADGEFVVPADVVSHLGNGSTDAGAKKLYAMMDKVRAARTGNKKQGKQIKAEKFLKV